MWIRQRKGFQATSCGRALSCRGRPTSARFFHTLKGKEALGVARRRPTGSETTSILFAEGALLHKADTALVRVLAYT